MGASYISAAVYSIIQKHVYKKEKASLRDYKRCIADISDIINKQLQMQQDETVQQATTGDEEAAE
jgi:hypothetical protein